MQLRESAANYAVMRSRYETAALQQHDAAEQLERSFQLNLELLHGPDKDIEHDHGHLDSSGVSFISFTLQVLRPLRFLEGKLLSLDSSFWLLPRPYLETYSLCYQAIPESVNQFAELVISAKAKFYCTFSGLALWMPFTCMTGCSLLQITGIEQQL